MTGAPVKLSSGKEVFVYDSLYCVRVVGPWCRTIGLGGDEVTADGALTAPLPPLSLGSHFILRTSEEFLVLRDECEELGLLSVYEVMWQRPIFDDVWTMLWPSQARELAQRGSRVAAWLIEILDEEFLKSGR